MELEHHEIVVIDDSLSIRELLYEYLVRDNYVVHLFKDGVDAVEKLKAIMPHLIILDINMPQIDGFTVCKNIKECPELCDIPVLFLSGNCDDDAKVVSFELGAVDYVEKPIKYNVLKARIKNHLRLYELQRNQVEENYKLENLVASKINALYQSQMNTIKALAYLAEYRDVDTGDHLERVQAYCNILSSGLAQKEKYKHIINEWYLKIITYSSSLHDIGKVGIPDVILLKPGKLTDEEFQIMKSHSAIGGETLHLSLREDPNNEFIKMGYEIAMYHHEKWDGTGYPEGLEGEKIPLCARIMALGDVYDALRSERCYKKGFSHEKAYAIIVEGRGTHFDPMIVDVFVEKSDEFNSVWELYQ